MPEEMLFIKNLDELIDVLAKHAPREFGLAARGGMTKSVIDVTGWAKQNAPVDTSRMETSVGYKVEGTFGEVTGFVGTNVVSKKGFSYPAKMDQPGPVRGKGRRPWLTPAVSEHVRDILHNFERYFKIAFKKLGF
jgi:hypothetical protein